MSRNGQRQIYYGFSAKFLEWGKGSLTNFDQWMADMKHLLSQEGVIYKGEFRGIIMDNVPVTTLFTRSYLWFNHALENQTSSLAQKSCKFDLLCEWARPGIATSESCSSFGHRKVRYRRTRPLHDSVCLAFPPGMVDHDTLHDAYARAGFVLYPTAFPGG